MLDGDPGDVDDYREPPPPEPGSIRALLEEWGDPPVASFELFMAMHRAESARECCAGCALEVNGEDGS